MTRGAWKGLWATLPDLNDVQKGYCGRNSYKIIEPELVARIKIQILSRMVSWLVWFGLARVLLYRLSS